MMNRAATFVQGHPSLRDHLTDELNEYAFIPLVAAAAPALAGLFKKKKKKAKPKPAPTPKDDGINKNWLFIGGVGLVGVLLLTTIMATTSRPRRK